MEFIDTIKSSLSISEHRNQWCAFVSGLLFFTGWWIIFDIASGYPNQTEFNHSYHICGIVATLSLIMINTVTNEQINGEVYTEGCCGPQTARIWLLTGFVMGFTSVIASIWILFEDYVVANREHKYPGVALLLQNCLIFGSSLLFKYGRSEESF